MANQKKVRNNCIGFLLALTCISFSPYKAQSEPTREFLMSATYGVLAGSLVGAATLAFRDNPGDHLKSIAVGASLGLYAGILLGAYVVYFVPDGDSGQQEVVPEYIEPYYEETPSGEGESNFEDEVPVDTEARTQWQPILSPIFSEGGVDGGMLGLQVAFF